MMVVTFTVMIMISSYVSDDDVSIEFSLNYTKLELL